MIAVLTKDEVSAQRNVERGQRGGRTVPENIRKEKWDAVSNARPMMAKLFGNNYKEIDNSMDLRDESIPIEQRDAKKKEIVTVTAADLGVTPVGWAGAGQKVSTVTQAEARKAGQVIEDDGEAFNKIVAFLETLKVI